MESNVKFCINCKYCSYNVMKRKRSKIEKFFGKIFSKIFLETDLEIERISPKCCNENVYDDKNCLEYLVKGEKTKKQLYCVTARTSSTNRFHCCEESGKYFEEDK